MTRRRNYREELEAAQLELREARETLDAIRKGEVDALVISGKEGHKVYSLSGAEGPYRVYIEHMQEGAVTVAASGLILYCNQRFADMLALPLEKVIGSALPAKLSPADWEVLSAAASATGDGVKHETQLMRPGAEPLPVHLAASRLPIGAESVLCLVVTDLTIQKEKAALRMAKEVAEKANAQKDEFLARLSHELRTPLTPTLMAAGELELDLRLPEDAREDLAMIRRNIELEARLIDDLLDLTRIASGKLELRFSRADLHAIVWGAIAVCQPDIDAKGLRVCFTPGADRPTVEADPVRLQQAVWNLLRNAVKFTPQGGMIEVGTRNEDGRVSVEVKDSGIGIAQETLPRLFRAFEQGGRQITRNFGGLGLGLSITRSIMEAHGGVVRGASAGPGRGASFTLELPESAAVIPKSA